MSDGSYWEQSKSTQAMLVEILRLLRNIDRRLSTEDAMDLLRGKDEHEEEQPDA